MDSIKFDEETGEPIYTPTTLADILGPAKKMWDEYAPDGKNIRFGMAAIKQVGEPVVEAIIKERNENGDFKNIFDL